MTGEKIRRKWKRRVIPPTNDLESAIVATLTPGAYTAILARQEQRHRRRNCGSVRPGSSRKLEAREHQHARVCRYRQQRHDRRIDRERRHWRRKRQSDCPCDRSLAQRFGSSRARCRIRLSNWLRRQRHDDCLQRQLEDCAPTAAVSRGKSKPPAIPPTNDLESALVQTLGPGNYTAIVRGANSTTGIAVVEAYTLQ